MARTASFSSFLMNIAHCEWSPVDGDAGVTQNQHEYTVCRHCAACGVQIRCKSNNLCVLFKVASVRAVYRQAIDVKVIVVERPF